jgi:hypothetical protein
MHEQNINFHRKNLAEIRKQVDNDKPQRYEFLQANKKKEELDAMRATEIDRENKILLDKIKTIMD